MTCILIKRTLCDEKETCTEGRQSEDTDRRRLCNNRGRVWSDVAVSQKPLRMADNNQKLEGGREGSCPRIFRDSMALLTT